MRGDLAEALAALQPGMRTLFVSGTLYEDAVEGNLVPTGCSYLHKPFGPAILQAKARELLPGTLAAAG